MRVRRQHLLRGFIVDFYVPAVRLVIELDGAVHDDGLQQVEDAHRQRALEAEGYRVLRLKNETVCKAPQQAAAFIRREIAAILSAHREAI